MKFVCTAYSSDFGFSEVVTGKNCNISSEQDPDMYPKSKRRNFNAETLAKRILVVFGVG